MTNCNCKNTDELRIVRGNAFGVQINIEARKLDGTLVEDFDLSQANATLKVIHYDQKTEKSFVVAGNSAIISFDNTLTLGRYGFEMYGTFNDSPWRWCVQNVFQIVETNEKANIPTWTFLTDDTYTMDGSMTLMSGEVYQSDWDETNIYSPAYIKNKPDVVLHPEFNQTVERIDHDIDAEELARQQADTTLQGNIDAEETRAKAAEKQNADDIDAIEEKIPAQASAQNQLADKQFVNSSISTATATYRGAYNLVSDLELTTDATEQEVAAALATKMTALGITPDNNDYCFVQVPTADATPTEIARVDRYKFNGTAWAFEFSLNNSGFTAAQWAALNSGITSGLVTKLSDLPTNSELTTLLGGKEDNSNKVTSLSAESTDTQYPSAKCVYDLHKANADDIDDIEALIPAQATPQNQLADKQYVDDGISTASATYRGAYNLVSDLELTTAATEQQISAALATKMTALGITPDNNDYCFVQVPTADATPTEIARVDRYKFNGTAWAFEFSLNNSGFTAAQWAALNSGITSGLVTKLSDLPTNSELTTLLGGKEDNSNKVTSLSAESTDTQYPSAKCVYDLHKANADDIDAIEEKIPSDASSSNKMATASDITNLSDSIAAILLLIPSAASSLNQLADKAFVNSSIATNTATYRGSYNLVSDLSLTISATEQQIAAALATKMTALSITPDNNDYCFVQVPTADATPTEISRIDRYKYNGTAWLYEYSLNNSSFTSAQWAAINSGITSALVAKLSALPTNAELTTALGVLTDGIAAINAKIPSAATSSNKLVDNTAMQSYVAQIVNALDATFNITSSDGHVTVQITQTNGVITALAITTSDIASAAALNLLSGRVTTAEGNISTNATDIANLQQLYNNLQQSDPIIIEPADTWPVANPSTHDIYRVIDRVNTPTQYYSDYMWNGTTMVLMAQYDNAIDDEPTPGSNNLVKSGGVAANIVYDISRAHASGSTLATYADLAAALGTNGANIPAEIHRGGMSVKFVCSSDNKYVQFRFKLSLFNNADFVRISNWQGVDKKPIATSENLLESGGSFYINPYLVDILDETYISSDGSLVTVHSAFKTLIYTLPIVPQIQLKGAQNTAPTAYKDLALYSALPGSGVQSIETATIPESGVVNVNIPSQARYMAVCFNANTMMNPEIIFVGAAQIRETIDGHSAKLALINDGFLNVETITGKNIDSDGNIVSGNKTLIIYRKNIFGRVKLTCSSGYGIVAEYGSTIDEDGFIKITSFNNSIFFDINPDTGIVVVTDNVTIDNITVLSDYVKVGAKTVNEKYGIPFINGGFINLNGAYQSSNQWAATNFFEVHNGDKLICNIISSQGATSVGFYDRNKNFINDVSIQNISVNGVVDIPESSKVCYARCTSYVRTNGIQPAYVYHIKNLNITKEALLSNYVNSESCNFNGKTALFVGDSITRGYLNDTVGNTPNPYCKLFCDAMGMTLVNNSVSGALYTPGYNNIKVISKQIEDSDVSNIDYLFIAAGTNDQGLGVIMSDFKTALNNTSAMITQKGIAASDVFVITPINKTQVVETDIADLDDYRVAITEWALSNEYTVIDGRKMPFPEVESDYARLVFSAKSSTIEDYLHPSEFGHKLYARTLVSMLKF